MELRQRLDSIEQQLKQIRLETYKRDRVRNRILVWMTIWSILLPVIVGGWIFQTSRAGKEVDTVADIPAPDTRVAPTCSMIGDWINTQTREESDESDAGYYIEDSWQIAPDGMRDYERVCIINFSPLAKHPDFLRSWQAVGCSDKNGGMASGGDADPAGSVATAQDCLASLRGSYLPE